MFNSATLIGRLTKAPELKKTQNDKSVCNFTIAVDRRFDREKTDFLSIVAWNKTAEFVCSYFHKGDAIGVLGRIETRSYEKDGVSHIVTEIVADEVFFTGGKTSGKDEKPDAIKDKEVEQIEDENDLPF